MFYLYKLGLIIANTIPVGLAFCLTTLLARLIYLFSGHKKAILKANIEKILPDKKFFIDHICKDIFINYAKYYLEFFLLNKKWHRKETILSLVEVEDEKNLYKALNSNMPTMLITGHIGNWDIGAVYISLLKNPLYVVVEKLEDAKICNLYKEIRKKYNIISIEATENFGRKILPLLKKEDSLILLPVDKLIKGIKNTEQVELFGNKVTLPSGYIRLVKNNKLRLFAGWLIRKKNNKFSMIIEELNSINSLLDVAKVLERRIKENIEQWYMLQNFFDTK